MVIHRLAFCITLIAAGPSWACGILEHAEPKVGSVANGSPTRITLTFSQALVPAESHIVLEDSNNRQTPLGKASVGEEDTVLSQAPSAPLPPGTYKVIWYASWKDCQSQTQGSYKFTVEP
jgi:methionine-rich copper-binding protein CopC